MKKMNLLKKGLGILLAATMMVGSASAVFAEEPEGVAR